MTALAKIKRDNTPRKHVLLPPESFEVNWKGRPDTPVTVGLRLLSVRELAEARLEAEREVAGIYAERDETVNTQHDVMLEQYNELLLCEAMARATCDPNNVTRSYFDNASITIREALTSEALRRLWDEYLVLSISTGVVIAPATDEALELLGRALRSPTVRAALGVEERKLVTHIMDQLTEVLPDVADAFEPEQDDDTDEDEIETDEAVYTVSAAPSEERRSE